MADELCIFCKIVKRQVPSNVVFENDNVLAFLDIRPVNEGHTLIIPKAHYRDIFDIPGELLGEVYRVTKEVAVAVKNTVKADGFSIFQQNGRAANQDIFHLHIHVIPRFSGQKNVPYHDLKLVSNGKLEKTALEIRRQFLKWLIF